MANDQNFFDKKFFDKIFSDRRMKRYFDLYPGNASRAITHYGCNLQLSEAMYSSLSVFEVTLRNALCRELKTMTGRDDWYAVFPTTPGLDALNKSVTQAIKNITKRHEHISPSKIVAELTFGFWVLLLNSKYERILWKDLRRAFPYMPKEIRQRSNISAPLNRFRTLRNRVFHNEGICWNMERIKSLHDEMIEVLGWINKDVPVWLQQYDRFPAVSAAVCQAMGWT